MTGRTSIPLAATLLLLALAFACGEPDPARDAFRRAPVSRLLVQDIGTQVAELDLVDTQSTSHTIESFRSRWVVLLFWSTRCPLCRDAEPARLRFAALCREQQVAYLPVFSNRDEYPEEIRDSLGDECSSGPVILDPTQRIATRFNITRTPGSVILDPDGIVRYVGSAMNSEVSRIDGEPANLDWLEHALGTLQAGAPLPMPKRIAAGTPIRRVPY